MIKNKTLSLRNIGEFNYEETKNNVKEYFSTLGDLEWELAKLNLQKGLTTNYDFATEYTKQPYMSSDRNILNLIAKDCKEEELKIHIANYYWAISILSDVEQIYIMEYFINEKYDKEIVDLLGFNNADSIEFKKLKRHAVYKFADILKIVVRKKQGA